MSDVIHWTTETIRRSFSGRLIGGPKMRESVCEALLKLPSKMIRYASTQIWFISSPDDAWALTLRGSDVAKQHLVILCDELFEEDQEKIKYTILHELGHVFLKHRNSMGFWQTQREINKQELEADQFAKRYLKLA